MDFFAFCASEILNIIIIHMKFSGKKKSEGLLQFRTAG